MNIFAVQTSRKGSRGVPGKNIVPVDDVPLYMYNLMHLKQSKLVKGIYLSTDDEFILTACEEHKCNIINRPKELCSSSASHREVLEHAIFEIERTEDVQADILVVVFGNSAFAFPADVDGSIKYLLDNPDYDSVQSVSRLDMYNPLRAFTIDDNGFLQPFVSRDEHSKYLIPGVPPGDRDSTKSAYFFNGSFWVCRRKNIVSKSSSLVYPWLGNKIKGWVQDFCFDVDEPWQLPLIKGLMQGGCK